MNSRADDDSRALRALSTLLDGTLAGLARYHLWELQLHEIRELPEAAGVRRPGVVRPHRGTQKPR